MTPLFTYEFDLALIYVFLYVFKNVNHDTDVENTKACMSPLFFE